MFSFLRYLLLFSALAAASSLIIPRAYDIEFPRTPGPEFDARVRKLYINRLEAERPDLVLLGDSTLLDGVDPERLAELTGLGVSSFDNPGSASAYWYLVLKNNIVEAKSKPPYVLVIFRDTILTAPGYRVHGSYFVQLDEFAGRDEPVLLERAYLNLMNPVERFAEGYFPLYAARVDVRRQIDAFVRYTLTSWIGCDPQCNDDRMYELFTSADLEPGQLKNAIATAEEYLYDDHQLDFDRQLPRSFLPEIVRLAQDNGIRLVFVRLKNLTTGTQESPAIRRYNARLADYVASENVIYLDFGTDPRLAPRYYADSLHLTPEGEALFTSLLAAEMSQALPLTQEVGK